MTEFIALKDSFEGCKKKKKKKKRKKRSKIGTESRLFLRPGMAGFMAWNG